MEMDQSELEAMWEELLQAIDEQDMDRLASLRERVVACLAQTQTDRESVLTSVYLARAGARTPDDSVVRAFDLVAKRIDRFTEALRTQQEKAARLAAQTSELTKRHTAGD